MESQIHEVMPPRPEAKKFAIQHMRPPSQWMPEIEVARRKSPDNSPPSKPLSNHRVLVNENLIVEIREVEGSHLPVHGESGRSQDRGENQGSPPFDRTSKFFHRHKSRRFYS